MELSQKVSMDIQWKVEEFPLDKGCEDHLFGFFRNLFRIRLGILKRTRFDVC